MVRKNLSKPNYYHLDDTNHDVINRYLSTLVERALSELQMSYCIELAEDNHGVIATTLGRIASYYYLHHTSVKMFRNDLSPSCTIPDIIQVLALAHEYNELPVRHNEDHVNSELAKLLPLPVDSHSYDSSNTKAHLLLQAHFSQQQLPSSDYHTDTKSVLDQAIRILQAMLDVSADQGWLTTTLCVIHMIQMVVQGRWLGDNSLLCLPNIHTSHLACFVVPGSRRKQPLDCLPELMQAVDGRPQVLSKMLAQELSQTQINQIYDVLVHLPVINVSLSLKGWWETTEGEQETRPVPQNITSGVPHKDDQWLTVHADQEYVLSVDLHRANKVKMRNTQAHSLRFPKPKDEGWVLVLGEVDSREVIAVKRVGYRRGRSSVQLAFYTPERVGRVIYTLYMMSDCYLGLDQQYDICLHVVESSLQAQVNSEFMDELDISD
ncbi:Activating signal cointegrator 1 complex subunit 3 [Lamellibrachia satsuma]|nr:Activating signal cointegrator 1 complex subunit 3 [Lamellibrachia satsuma]